MKQTKNKFLWLFMVAGLAFSLQSCLKNGKFYQDFSKGSAAVELPLAAKYVNKPLAVSFDVSSTPITYYAVVNVASVNVPSSPVTATLSVDQAYLDQYNADQDAAAKKAQADYLAADPSHTVNDGNYPPDYVPYELMPDSTYQISSTDITIPAGHRLDSVPIQIFTNKMAPGHIYLLPLTISKASVNISNWNHLMLNIGAKNKYDGNYDLLISTSGWGAYGIADGGSYDWGQVGMVTSGANSVVYSTGYQMGFGPGGNGPLGFGATNPEFTFDPATNNLVSVTNLAAPDSRNRAFHIDPAVTDSRFDPATKTMYLAYIMTQNGRPNQYIKDTLTYIGPR